LTRPQVVVVDYGMGNRRSVVKALEYAGAQVALSAEPDALSGADGLVLPGVGAFPRAMDRLRSLGLVEPLRGLATQGKPLLGICLGMQLLFEHSEEFTRTEGLGLIPGTVTALRAGGLRVPHIGWNEVRFERPSPLTSELPSAGCAFYHVHSFAARPARSEDVIGTTEYGERFPTIVARAAVAGVQFHPEKSSRPGLRMLAGFVRACRAPAAGPALRA
jgi:glutamine amidotransferase